MPYFVETDPAEVDVEEYTLEVDDYEENYSSDDGYGIWLWRYLQWLEAKVKELLAEEEFGFSECSVLNDETLDEIEDDVLRNRIKKFTDEYYPEFKDFHVSLPNYDNVISSVSEYYCDECDTPWRDIENEEGEVIDREWIGCPERCDGFYDDVDDSIRQQVECDTSFLDDKWEDEVADPLDRIYADGIPKVSVSLDRYYS